MSKAEDLSRQYVLPFLDNHYEKYGEHKQMELSRFDGYDVMSAYEEGYHQAEEDLAMTIEDIETIHTFLYAVKNNKQGVFTFTRMSDEKYQEVLKRFKDFKERKDNGE